MANGKTKVRYAKPTTKALNLAASKRGQAIAKSIGRQKMVNSTLARYGMAPSRSSFFGGTIHSTFKKLLRRKRQLESFPRRR